MLFTVLLSAAVWGYCPGAELKHTGYGHESTGVAAQVAAHKALRACKKAGIKVPPTVAEYNNEPHETKTLAEALKEIGYKPLQEW